MKRTWKRAPAGTRSNVRGLACEVMRSIAFSLLTSVSSSSRFSRMGGVMLSISSGASKTVRRAGVALWLSKRLAGDALHASGVAAEQQADVIVGPVALVDPHFLALAPRKIDQLRGHRRAGELLEQRADLAAQRTARDVRAAGGVLYDRVVRAADLERSFARADVQSGFAMQLAFEDQLANQFQFRLRGVRAHSSSRVVVGALYSLYATMASNRSRKRS